MQPITIRDLLIHTSGLGYPSIGTPEVKAMDAKNRITGGAGAKESLSLAESMNQLGILPLLFQPGEKWMYGINKDLLGYPIEVWSGMSVDEFFSKHIFQPLGMKDTYFNVPASKASRLVNFFQQNPISTSPPKTLSCFRIRPVRRYVHTAISPNVGSAFFRYR